MEKIKEKQDDEWITLDKKTDPVTLEQAFDNFQNTKVEEPVIQEDSKEE